MTLDPTTVAKHAFFFAKEIYDRMQAVSENDDVRRSIEAHIKTLENIATDLNNLGLDELPSSCRDAIDSFTDSLDICRSACNNLNRTGKVAKLIKVGGHKSELETMNVQLKRATDNLQLVLSQVAVSQNKKLSEAVLKGTEEVIGAVIHPNQGVYLPKSKFADSRPHRIDRPEVALDVSGDLMEVKWKDERNREDTIDQYEVQYDEEKSHVVSANVDECTTPNDNIFSMKLGQPRIKLGTLYSVQVRGTNGAGPGDWSEPTIFRFKFGPPNKPKKPVVILQSPTEVMINATRLSEREENGSRVTRCKVEFTQAIDVDDPTWDVLESNIKQRTGTAPDIKLKIGSLVPNTKYCFRIKMINDHGESPPSESREVETTQLVPGPVKNLRISSKRTDKTIKLRWDESDLNPQFAHKYKVQIRMKKERAWTDYATVGKRAAKVINLKTDTRYLFRVQPINDKGGRGNWSNEVEAETRFGAIGRTLGTVGAFVGGTVGGPFVGAVGGGAMAGASAGKVPDSQAGQRAAKVGAGAGGAIAGGLFGLVGAPIIGGMAAILANKKLSGEMEDMSPQTSDDENELGFWSEVFKTSKKMTKNVFDEDS